MKIKSDKIAKAYKNDGLKVCVGKSFSGYGKTMFVSTSKPHTLAAADKLWHMLISAGYEPISWDTLDGSEVDLDHPRKTFRSGILIACALPRN